MKTRVISLTTLLLAATALGQPADSRAVQVTVSCTDGTGAALGSVPVSVITKVGKFYGTTSASGVAVLELQVENSEQMLFLRLSAAGAPDEAEEARAMQRLDQVSKNQVVPKVVMIPLVASQTSYTKALNLQQGRQLKMRCVKSTGGAMSGVLAMEGNVLNPVLHRDGNYECTGAPLDAHVVMAMHTNGWISQIPVPASTGGLDMGDVTIAMPVMNGTATLTFTNSDNMDNRTGDELAAVVVSTDGQKILELPLHHEVSVAEYGSNSPSNLPAGEYWVCPGSIVSGISADTLVRLVRAGTDLSTSGIPKITVPANGSVQQTIDAAAAQQAILQAGGITPG